MRTTLVLRTAWRTVIGLELHVQLQAASKLLSRSKTSWDDEVNTNVSLFDVGYPGTLPTISPAVVKKGLQTALALNCQIPSTSRFDRKHYFYHDQPLGYQVTQHYHPIAKAGYLSIPTNPPKDIRIQQIQLEQDTAKTTTTGDQVLIDYNRAGTGLVEIVTEADISSAEEAALFLKTIRGVLRRIGASGADMEKGSLRVDCNISIHRESEPLGDRVELKNLAVINQMQKAISFEVERQKKVIMNGGRVEMETRRFDLASGQTRSLRSKEEVKDYRYMPDGNLPVLRIDPVYLKQLKSTLPELPSAASHRLVSQHPSLTLEDATSLVALSEDFAGVHYFERTVAVLVDPTRAKLVSNWMVNYLAPALDKGRKALGEGVREAELAELVNLVADGSVTHVSAQRLLLLLIDSPPGPSRLQTLVDTHSLSSLPPSILTSIITRVLASQPKIVQSVKDGNLKDVNRLVGGVMKETKGRVDAKEVMKRVREALGVD